MKVSEIMEMLNRYSLDDELCILWWDKENFVFPEDDEMMLTDEAWLKVSQEFDKWDNPSEEVTQWIAEAVIEHAVPKTEES